MAYMQRRRLTVDSDISGDDPWRYKLPKIGKYTCFEIRLACQRANTRTLNTVVYPIETQIEKVELLREATRPIISLTGQQLDAMNYWDFKRPNPRRYRQLDASPGDLTLFLLAGRDFYDREYGYDMQKMGEVYLEIDHALTADATDKFDVDTSVITLYAWQWLGPGQPNFKGYFRSRQLAYWTTTGTSTIKTIAIPIGYPIRRICVQAGTRSRTLGATFEELEVRINDGEYSPVTVTSMMDWTMAEVQEYGLQNQIGGMDYGVAGTIMDLPYWWSYYESLDVIAYGAAGNFASIWGMITLPARFYADLDTAGEVVFSNRGWGFQKCLRIGFDHERDGFDLLPTAGLGALDLVVTEAITDYAARCFVQDVISYAPGRGI